MGVVECEQHRFGRAGGQQTDRELLETGLAQLRVEAGRELVVGDPQSEEGPDERQPRAQFGGQDVGEVVDQLRDGQTRRDGQELAPDLPPGGVRRDRTVGAGSTVVHGDAVRRGAGEALGEQPGLAGADRPRERHHLTSARSRRGDGGRELGQLLDPADQGRRPGRGWARRSRRQQGCRRRRRGLALEGQLLDFAEGEGRAHRAADLVGDQHAAGRGPGHQAGREVHRIPQAAERASLRVAVGAAAQPAPGHPHPDPGDGTSRQVEQVQGRGTGPRGVVLVGGGGAEDAVQVGALVADRELEEVAAVAVDDALGADQEHVEQLGGVVVEVEVDPAELDEDRHGGTQVRDELTAAGLHPAVDGRQQPLPDHVVREHEALQLEGALRSSGREPAEHTDRTGNALALFDREDAVAERSEHRGGHDDLPRRRGALGRGDLVHQRAGQHVDQLDRRVPDHEPPRGAGGHRDLDAQGDHPTPGGGDRADPRHRLLHGQCAAGATPSVIPLEPAGDGIATEVEHRAALAVQALDEGVEDPLQHVGELLCAALGAELVGKRLGEGGEAGDVCEEGRAAHPTVDARSPREGSATVFGDVGVRVVTDAGGSRSRAGDVRLGLTHRTRMRTSRKPNRSPGRSPETSTRST